MHQYALMEDGTTMHSSPQMEWNQVSVDDWSQHVGGHQHLLPLNGYQILLKMCHGLAYMDMHPFSDKDWDHLLHIALTLETPWDPQVLDSEQSNDPNWFDHSNDPLCLIWTLMHMGTTMHHCITQSATSLPDDEKTPTDVKDYTSFTWASLTEDALNTIVESSVL
jgi:hypothetical protein